MFLKIDIAYKVLKDVEQRKAYDSEQFQKKSHLIIHDTIKSSECQFDKDAENFYHICKCGGIYILDEQCKDEEYLIECDECSLVIRVINENKIES
jgi:diphthamide biosynthesis protein 4